MRRVVGSGAEMRREKKSIKVNISYDPEGCHKTRDKVVAVIGLTLLGAFAAALFANIFVRDCAWLDILSAGAPIAAPVLGVLLKVISFLWCPAGTKVVCDENEIWCSCGEKEWTIPLKAVKKMTYSVTKDTQTTENIYHCELRFHKTDDMTPGSVEYLIDDVYAGEFFDDTEKISLMKIYRFIERLYPEKAAGETEYEIPEITEKEEGV